MNTQWQPMRTSPGDGRDIMAKVPGHPMWFRVSWDGDKCSTDELPVAYDFAGAADSGEAMLSPLREPMVDESAWLFARAPARAAKAGSNPDRLLNVSPARQENR